jgi:hypothetical protein
MAALVKSANKPELGDVQSIAYAGFTVKTPLPTNVLQLRLLIGI